MTSVGPMWDQRFATGQWPREPDPFLVALADPLPAGRGLDLGSGPGRNSVWLAAKGWDMTLVDASRVGLDLAVAAASAEGAAVTTIEANLDEWRPDPSYFDLVIVANLHPGPDRRGPILQHATEALCPGGHLYVVGHHLDNLGRHGPPDPDRLLTDERLRAALPSELDVHVLETRSRRSAGGGDDAPAERHEVGGDEGRESDLVVVAWAGKPQLSNEHAR